MKHSIALINASPRPVEQSVTSHLLFMLENRIKDNDIEKVNINIVQSLSANRSSEDFDIVSKADAVVIAFPLYFFCLPGILIQFLEDYYHLYQKTSDVPGNQRIYAIANCGFPEPEINEEAIRVIKSFSLHIGAEFRFGILLTGSGNTMLCKGTDQLNDAFDKIIMDIMSNSHTDYNDIYIKPGISQPKFISIANQSFISMALKYGLNEKNLLCKPYRENEEG